MLGTPVRLAPGAADAVIGTSTQTLASAVITPADIITVGGVIATANPSGFTIAGSTVIPGAKGVVVNGTVVSLAPGGTLFVGNSSTVLPTSGPGTSAGAGVFEGGAGKVRSSGLGWLFGYTVLGVVGGGLFLAR